MANYRRDHTPGATWFFTVAIADRQSDLLVREIGHLRTAVRRVRGDWPFLIDAWVVLPDHMHVLWTLPQGDHNFSTRWRLIKSNFSRGLPRREPISPSRLKKGERGLWQRRFWEDRIRDDEDFRRHMDYIHINPLKHGYVQRVADWPFSTFVRYVRQGIYTEDWGVGIEIDGEFGE